MSGAGRTLTARAGACSSGDDDARALLTPLLFRQPPWRPTEFEQLVSYLRPTPAPRASSTLLLSDGGFKKSVCEDSWEPQPL